MLKLSIIIPVYNVEKYIRKCIESCLDQDLPKDEYEIICVDDGSKDTSISIVNSIINRETEDANNSNIRIITRQNGGQSAARNTGIKEAKGDYIWFVDADDWIEPFSLGKLLKKAYYDKLDVLCFNLQLVFPSGETKRYGDPLMQKYIIYSGAEFICNVKTSNAPWVALFRKEFLESKNIRFIEGIIHEDLELVTRAYSSASRIAFADIVIYNYFQREGSTMKSKQNAKRCRDLLTVADSLYKFANDSFLKGTPAYNAVMAKVAFAFSQSLAFYMPEVKSIRSYKEKEYYPLYISPDLDGKTKWKYRLINLSIWVYIKIYKFKKI